METLFRKTATAKEWKEQNNCTYYVTGGTVKDSNSYVMGFTLKIIQGVTTSLTGVKGGWVCELRHVNHGPNEVFNCFLSSSGFVSPARFQADITETPGMPSIVVQNLDTKLLGTYVAWKNQQYSKFCKTTKQFPDKAPVEHRNLQSDGKTFCFAPDVCYVKTAAGIERVSSTACGYYWVPSMLKGLVPVELYTGTEATDILEVIRCKLEADNMADTFVNFLLVCGHTCVLSFHYKEILAALEHVPGLVVTGPRNTGKSFSTEVAASFLGVNGIKICVAKDTILPALRDRYTDDHMPLIVHDLQDGATAATALHECFEGRDVKKTSGLLTPGTSVAITCNEKQMGYLQTRYGALSRAAVVPMLREMGSQTDEEFDLVRLGKLAASKHFESLLNITQAELEALQRRSFSLRSKVAGRLPNVTDSHNRIAENYGILIAATELFLEKTGHALWSGKVEPFVLNNLLPDAAPFYENTVENRGNTAVEVIESNVHLTPTVQQNDAISLLCTSIAQMREKDPQTLSRCFVVQKEKPYVAVKEDEFGALLVSHRSTASMEVLRLFAATKSRVTVKFSDHAKRALIISKSLFSDAQMGLMLGAALPGTEGDNGEGTFAADDHTPEIALRQSLATLSPFKKLPGSFQPSSSRNLGAPLANSTLLPGARQTSSSPRDGGVSPVTTSSREQSPTPAQEAAARYALRPPPAPRQNASFTIVSRVAPSENANLVTPSTARTTGKTTRSDCSACDDKKDTNGSDKTYVCGACRLRYHMACQTQSEEYWPANVRKSRKCSDCVKKLIQDAL